MEYRDEDQLRSESEQPATPGHAQWYYVENGTVKAVPRAYAFPVDPADEPEPLYKIWALSNDGEALRTPDPVPVGPEPGAGGSLRGTDVDHSGQLTGEPSPAPRHHPVREMGRRVPIGTRSEHILHTPDHSVRCAPSHDNPLGQCRCPVAKIEYEPGSDSFVVRVAADLVTQAQGGINIFENFERALQRTLTGEGPQSVKEHPCRSCRHMQFDACQHAWDDPTYTGNKRRVIQFALKNGTGEPTYKHVYQFYCEGKGHETEAEHQAKEKTKRKPRPKKAKR